MARAPLTMPVRADLVDRIPTRSPPLTALAHLGDDPDELLAGTDADQPVVAVRAHASVDRPGGSAHAQWRRLRAGEWAAWTRTLPWRVAATLGIGAAGGVLGSLLTPRLSVVLGGLAAVAAGWALRFRPSPAATAWRRGAAGQDEGHAYRSLGGLTRLCWASELRCDRFAVYRCQPDAAESSPKRLRGVGIVPFFGWSPEVRDEVEVLPGGVGATGQRAAAGKRAGGAGWRPAA